jgi:hypothetical protein
MGNVGPFDSSPTPGVFYTYSYTYNHTHRRRLEKLLYKDLSRSPNGCLQVVLQVLPDPGGGFASEIATRRFQN